VCVDSIFEHLYQCKVLNFDAKKSLNENSFGIQNCPPKLNGHYKGFSNHLHSGMHFLAIFRTPLLTIKYGTIMS
jgi:penicillin-binding protein-related factor A (putative recombinase)